MDGVEIVLEDYDNKEPARNVANKDPSNEEVKSGEA